MQKGAFLWSYLFARSTSERELLLKNSFVYLLPPKAIYSQQKRRESWSLRRIKWKAMYHRKKVEKKKKNFLLNSSFAFLLYFPISGEEFVRFRCDWGKRIICRGQNSMKYFQYLLYLLIHIIAFLIVSRLQIVFWSKKRGIMMELCSSLEFLQFSWKSSIKIGRNNTWTIVIVCEKPRRQPLPQTINHRHGGN